MMKHVVLSGAVIGSTGAAWILARLCREARLPPVLGMLGFGFALRYMYPSDDLEQFTDPLVDVALAAMGLEIGSHLNEQTLGPIAGQMVRFMGIFVTIVVTVVAVGIRGLLPDMVPFAALAASIAVERSSPECLQGVMEAKAKGPFATSLMCISAMQDVGALVCFVVSEIALGSTSLREGVGHLGLMLTSTAMASGLAIGLGYLAGTKQPMLCVVTLCLLLASAAEYTPSELLLSAVCCGVALNYRKVHPTTLLITRGNQIVAVLLFTWMGYRMNVMNFLGMSPIVIHPAHGDVPAVTHPSAGLGVVLGLYVLRLVALFAGSFCASLAVGMRQHAPLRWMGLVTQLAIALSLVQRGERSFPHAAPLMRAYGGSVLCSLVTGPPLLQLALHRSGEASAAGTRNIVVEDGTESEGSSPTTDRTTATTTQQQQHEATTTATLKGGKLAV